MSMDRKMLLNTQTGEECPLCKSGTVEHTDSEVLCRGECGAVMRKPPRCICGHTKEQHDTKTRGCKFVASVPSRAKKRYGRGRNRYIQCDCKRYRPIDFEKENP